MKLTRTILALFVTVLVLPTAAVGQDDEVIENIIVASQKSPGDLRRDLWRSEKDFYSIYNKLNDDSLYDVHCIKEAPTGSVIKSQIRICKRPRPRSIWRAPDSWRIESEKPTNGLTAASQPFSRIAAAISPANASKSNLCPRTSSG